MTRALSRLGRAGAVAVGSALVALALPTSAASAAGSGYVCQGGSIPAGTYSSVTVAGFCALDSGSVTVSGNLTVAPGAGLLAAFGGSDLHVGKNLVAGAGSIVVLGCEPGAFACFNDPTGITNDTIGMNFSATDALMVLAHNNGIGGNVTQNGGGGGVTCDLFPLGPDGPPAYTTWEDNVIGGNAALTGVNTCWMGFIRNTVSGNAVYSANITADPDGNEVVTNTIARNLNCSANAPAPQVGDSTGSPNTVGGRRTGQCSMAG